MKLNFKSSEINILNNICDIQIESYSRIIRGDLDKEQIELLESYQASIYDIRREANWKLDQYQQLKLQPLYLGIMDDKEISMIRHILYHIEFEGGEEIPASCIYGIQSLWKKLFTIEEERQPMLLIPTLLNKYKNGKTKNVIRIPRRRLVPTRK